MPKNVASEQQTIQNILKLAREQGVEDKVKGLIMKYQDIIKGAKNQEERDHMAALGIIEIHKTIGCVGSLVLNGVEVIPEDPGYKEAISLHKGCSKIDE